MSDEHEIIDELAARRAGGIVADIEECETIEKRELTLGDMYARAKIAAATPEAARYCEILAQLCAKMIAPNPAPLHRMLAATLPAGAGKGLHREVYAALAKASSDAPIAVATTPLNFGASARNRGGAIHFRDDTTGPQLEAAHCVAWCQLLGLFVERGRQEQALQWTHELHILLQYLAKPRIIEARE